MGIFKETEEETEQRKDAENQVDDAADQELKNCRNPMSFRGDDGVVRVICLDNLATAIDVRKKTKDKEGSILRDLLENAQLEEDREKQKDTGFVGPKF